MGGIGRYAEMLGCTLPFMDKANGYYLLFSNRKGKAPLSQTPNVEERVFECGMIDARWEQLELPGELAGIGADLYHSTCFSLPVAGGAKRNVVTVHDVIFRRHPELVDARLRDYLDGWTAVALDLADRVITVSEFSKREMCDLYGVDPGRVRVVYNAVDARFKPAGASEVKAAQKKLKLPTHYVLYVGALEEKKNIPRLLEAWKMLSGRSVARGLKLVLAGGSRGKGFDAAGAVKAAGVDESVILAGRIPDAELPAVMTGAELFVYPSLYEGFGLPVLEAMSCGAPVVTSGTSSLGEIAGDAARLADPEIVDELAAAISAVLADGKLAKVLREKGRKRAAEFTPERCAGETLAVYREVLS
jgi:glycosyltransferase involved in cell wall biosynthesis